MLRQKKKSLFTYIFISYMMLAIALVFFFMGSFLVTDITGELERNNYKYYYGKIDQKRNELEYVLLDKWANMTSLEPLKRMIALKASSQGFEGIDEEIASELVRTISAIDATGALIVLNSESAPNDSIYLRNSNTKSSVSTIDNFTMNMGSFNIAQRLSIALSDKWIPSFLGGDLQNRQLIQYVNERFKKRKEEFFWHKFRYGNQSSLMLFTPVYDGQNVIAVIGVEVNENLLTYYLNYVELSAAKKSAYAIAKFNPVYKTYTNEFMNGPHVTGRLPNKPLHLRRIENINFITYSGSTYIAYAVDDYIAIALPLRISEGISDRALIAYIPREEFYVHSGSMRDLFRQSAFVTIFLSIGLAFVIAKWVSSPVNDVIRYAEKPEGSKELGIREYDHIMSFVEKMTHGVAESNERMDFVLQLLQTSMIVIKHDLIAGMAYKYGMGGELLTHLFGEDDNWPKSGEVFGMVINATYEKVTGVKYVKDEVSDYKVLCINRDGKDYYVKSVVQIEKDSIYYFLIDYTNEVLLEEQKAYEVDYDHETGLLHREAFKRRVGRYFSDNPDAKGAVVMWVLDDIDFVNSAYGYLVGDAYIRSVGSILKQMTDGDSYVSRYANNKFVTFIPFNQMREKVVATINEYSMRISKEKVRVNEHKHIGIKLTKGISWYPSDSTDITQLCTFAEFAYTSSTKRAYNTNHQFSMHAYENHVLTISSKEHFDELIEKKEVDFAFQPIIALEERTIIGYEALMRPKSKNLMYVEDVLRMAYSHGKLVDLEVLTMQQVFKKVKKNIDLFGDKLVFINSIRDLQVSKRILGSLFDEDLDKRVVIDLSDVEKLESDVLWSKANWAHVNDFKLCFDNFGLWYSSGTLISTIKPEFMKISKELVRNIHEEADKQSTVRELVSLCDSHDVKLIAVGVESKEELHYLKQAGVKYAQGFALGEPKFDVIDFLEDDVLELLDSI